MLVDHVDLLPRLFGGIIVPMAVHAELLHMAAPDAVRRWAANPQNWLTISQTPPHDDRAGVAVTRGKSLAVTGTLGILYLAGSRGLIDVTKIVARLKATSFRNRPELLNELVARHRSGLDPE